MRQRVRLRSSALAWIGRVLVAVLALALIFYGAILLLLALKVDPGTLNAISGYRDALFELSSIREADLSTLTRVVAGAIGLLAFLVFALLALKALPRPHLARQQLELTNDDTGVVQVRPRAIERVAETAALQHADVARATGRYGDEELTLGLGVQQAAGAAQTMRDVQTAVVAALADHGLPAMPVHLTLTAFERRTQRELT